MRAPVGIHEEELRGLLPKLTSWYPDAPNVLQVAHSAKKNMNTGYDSSRGMPRRKQWDVQSRPLDDKICARTKPLLLGF